MPPGWRSATPCPTRRRREYDLVFDVKADGWFNVLHAARRHAARRDVAFSSVAGRFGNAGQTDYSAANDLLCKSCSAACAARVRTCARIAIDWTAWAGIGMATRGSIPKMMEAAGIDMLPPEAGVPVDPARADRRRSGRRGRRRRRARACWPASSTPTGGLDPSGRRRVARADDSATSPR